MPVTTPAPLSLPSEATRPSPVRRPCVRWAVASLAASLACLGTSSFAQNGAATPPPAPPTAPANASAAIQAARLDAVWVYPARSAVAQVVPRNESRLAAEVSGPVLRWYADVGSTVRAGDTLAQIDPTDLDLALQRAQAARDAAQARLTLAQAQLQRARELVAQGFFSQEALAQRQTEVALLQAERDSAQAQWQTARRQRDKATVRAPFAGAVVQRLAQTGEMVAPGTVLFMLAQTGEPEISTQVTPDEVAGLRAARDMTFDPDGGSGPLPVRLLRVTPTLQGVSRTQTARLAFTAPTAGAPAGSSGVLRWNDPTPHVPPALVVRRGAQLGVFVKEQGRARYVPLPGAQEGRAAPVSLPAATHIVVQGQASLRDGQPLN